MYKNNKNLIKKFNLRAEYREVYNSTHTLHRKGTKIT